METSEKYLNKQDAAEVKNFTRIPNMLIFDYHKTLSPQEKWLYVCLKHLCGERGTRHLSIRYISEQTGISIGALAGSKDPTKNNPGMLRNLHNAGMIHAEIKKKKQNGKEKEQAQYHITITDVWALNQAYFQERSEYEHLDSESVREMNISEQERSRNEHKCSEYEHKCSGNEQERSDFDTILRLDTRLENKITEQEIREEENTSPAPLPEKKKEKIPRIPKPRSSKLEPEPLSAQEQAIYDEWRSIFKKPIPLTDRLREHISKLVAYETTPGEIVACRLWMYANDTKKWYTQHGLGLGDVVRELERFRSLNFVPDVGVGLAHKVSEPPMITPKRFDYEALRRER